MSSSYDCLTDKTMMFAQQQQYFMPKRCKGRKNAEAAVHHPYLPPQMLESAVPRLSADSDLHIVEEVLPSGSILRFVGSLTSGLWESCPLRGHCILTVKRPLAKPYLSAANSRRPPLI